VKSFVAPPVPVCCLVKMIDCLMYLEKSRSARTKQTFIRYRCPDNTPSLPEFRQTEQKEEKRKRAGTQVSRYRRTEQTKIPRNSTQYPEVKERQSGSPHLATICGIGGTQTHSFQHSCGKIKRPIKRAKKTKANEKMKSTGPATSRVSKPFPPVPVLPFWPSPIIQPSSNVHLVRVLL
jgi:hypothetical protein